jgi:hypothetical protein
MSETKMSVLKEHKEIMKKIVIEKVDNLSQIELLIDFLMNHYVKYSSIIDLAKMLDKKTTMVDNFIFQGIKMYFEFDEWVEANRNNLPNLVKSVKTIIKEEWINNFAKIHKEFESTLKAMDKYHQEEMEKITGKKTENFYLGIQTKTENKFKGEIIVVEVQKRNSSWAALIISGNWAGDLYRGFHIESTKEGIIEIIDKEEPKVWELI